MKKFRSKLLSCILAFAVCLSCLSATIYAAPMEKNAKEEFTLDNQVTDDTVPSEADVKEDLVGPVDVVNSVDPVSPVDPVDLIDTADAVDPVDPEPQRYKVTFDYNYNSPSQKQILTVNEGDLQLNVFPRRDGYELFGWSLSPDDFEPAYKAGEFVYISEDNTFYAIWRKINVASVNKLIDVTINPDNPYIYYEFTAPKADTYIFASQSECDPCLEVYDALGNKIGTEDDLYYEFIDVNDSNFEYRKSMEAGDKLLLCLHLYKNDQSGSFQFLIRPESEVPDVPELKSLANVSGGVKVAWNPVDNASYYLVFFGLSTESIYTDVMYVEGTNCTVPDLKSGKTYDFAVMAFDSYDCYNGISGYLSMRYFKNLTLTKVANVSSGIKLSWDKMAGASGYVVYRKTSGTNYERIAKITDGSTLSYVDTAVKAKNGTKYTYKVKPYYKSYYGTGTEKSYYRLTNTNVATLTNPSAGKMKVTWTKNTKVTAYQIQYSKSSSFSSGNKTVTVTGASNVAKTISALTKGSTYYVRIRTYKTVSGTKYYSAWGTKKSIKIKR